MRKAVVRRILQQALLRKGFHRTMSDHRKFVFHTLAGKRTGIWTKISHGSLGEVLSAGLVGDIRRQLGGLSPHQFEQLLECPFSQEHFEAHLRERNLI